MHTIFILVVIFGSIVLALAVVGGTIIMAINIIKGGSVSRKGRKLYADEARMIQEIYQGLSRMEKRVDALETILFDDKGKER